jgi:hypothetical protein
MFPRLLVLANLAFSFLLLAWALSLASNRLDWVDAKTDGGTVKGQITLLKEEIDRAAKGAGDLSAAYADRTAGLSAAEAFREDRRRKYAARLREAQSGNFYVQLPLAGPYSGFTDLDKVGPKETGPDGKPLRGSKALADEIKREIDAANRALAGDAPLNPNPEGGLDAALADNGRFDELTGKLGASDHRKLQAVIGERMAAADAAVLKQKEIATNLRDEAAQLGAARVNGLVQLQDLQDRLGQLGRRLAAVRGGG